MCCVYNIFSGVYIYCIGHVLREGEGGVPDNPTRRDGTQPDPSKWKHNPVLWSVRQTSPCAGEEAEHRGRLRWGLHGRCRLRTPQEEQPRAPHQVRREAFSSQGEGAYRAVVLFCYLILLSFYCWWEGWLFPSLRSQILPFQGRVKWLFQPLLLSPLLLSLLLLPWQSIVERDAGGWW